MMIIFRKPVPPKLIRELQSVGVAVDRTCEITVLQIVDHPEALAIYKNFLRSYDDVDPMLSLHFGPVRSPYVNLHTQMDVLSILASFQPLRADELAGEIERVHINAEPPGGFPYYNSQMSTLAAIEEIEKTPYFALPSILALPLGSTICYLRVQYRAVLFVLRLCRA